MLGTTEIVVIALVILVLFGASAIPKFAKSLGEAKKEYKNATAEEDSKKVEASKSDKTEEKK